MPTCPTCHSSDRVIELPGDRFTCLRRHHSGRPSRATDTLAERYAKGIKRAMNRVTERLR